ncbi:MAG: tetratricopeptide repeat protein, partial [Pseudomonadota bacterium]
MNLYANNALVTIGLAVMVVACGNNQPKTLASLQYQAPPEPVISELPAAVPSISHEQVRQEYKELLTIFEEDHLKEQIERRIADVYMMEGVYKQNKGKQQASYYSEATRAYKEILEKYPDSPANAEVLYQLSKAYDSEGRQDQSLQMLDRLVNQHPDYKGISEAQFRKGDIHFSNQNYKRAESSYSAVIRTGNHKLLLNAHYMLGWSRYKQRKYTASVNSFSYVLKQLLADKDDFSTLSKGQKPLAEDTVNSISLGLDKLGGAEKITAFDALADQAYSWMIYDNLGQYYFAKELYEDSASSYRLFVTQYNNSDRAPGLHTSLIETYKKGGFAKQALVEKATYVDAYGLGSTYANSRSGFTAPVANSLKTYMKELASHYHSEGQQLQKQIAQFEKGKPKQAGWQQQREKLYALSIAAFDQAAGFYQRYINTFPQDMRVDEIRFLKAETLFSSYQYPQAIIDYELVAYQPVG